jgi:hypothetical protein
MIKVKLKKRKSGWIWLDIDQKINKIKKILDTESVYDIDVTKVLRMILENSQNLELKNNFQNIIENYTIYGPDTTLQIISTLDKIWRIAFVYKEKTVSPIKITFLKNVIMVKILSDGNGENTNIISYKTKGTFFVIGVIIFYPEYEDKNGEKQLSYPRRSYVTVLSNTKKFIIELFDILKYTNIYILKEDEFIQDTIPKFRSTANIHLHDPHTSIFTIHDYEKLLKLDISKYPKNITHSNFLYPENVYALSSFDEGDLEQDDEFLYDPDIHKNIIQLLGINFLAFRSTISEKYIKLTVSIVVRLKAYTYEKIIEQIGIEKDLLLSMDDIFSILCMLGYFAFLLIDNSIILNKLHEYFDVINEKIKKKKITSVKKYKIDVFVHLFNILFPSEFILYKRIMKKLGLDKLILVIVNIYQNKMVYIKPNPSLNPKNMVLISSNMGIVNFHNYIFHKSSFDVDRQNDILSESFQAISDRDISYLSHLYEFFQLYPQEYESVISLRYKPPIMSEPDKAFKTVPLTPIPDDPIDEKKPYKPDTVEEISSFLNTINQYTNKYINVIDFEALKNFGFLEIKFNNDKMETPERASELSGRYMELMYLFRHMFIQEWIINNPDDIIKYKDNNGKELSIYTFFTKLIKNKKNKGIIVDKICQFLIEKLKYIKLLDLDNVLLKEEKLKLEELRQGRFKAYFDLTPLEKIKIDEIDDINLRNQKLDTIIEQKVTGFPICDEDLIHVEKHGEYVAFATEDDIYEHVDDSEYVIEDVD